MNERPPSEYVERGHSLSPVSHPLDQTKTEGILRQGGLGSWKALSTMKLYPAAHCR